VGAATVLFVIAAAVGRYTAGFPEVLAFVLAALALAGQAWIVSVATEQLGEHFGPAATGTLQSTVGNLPEFFVVLFALEAGDKTVAEAAVLGSILVNALLVLGLVLIAGSLRAPDGVMRFNPKLPKDTATLLLVASFMIVLLGIVHLTHEPAASHIRTISVIGAVAILVVYATWMAHYLRSDGSNGGHAGAGPLVQPRIPMRTSAALLILAGTGSAFVSDWFVHALEPTIHQLHISQAFAGLVIVAIAGNAVENVAGIYLAYRGQADLAISVVKNSVSQVAAFLYPVLVLVSLLTATQLTFALPPLYIGALFVTVVLVWQVTGDGEGTPFEGMALIATFVVLATVVSFEH